MSMQKVIQTSSTSQSLAGGALSHVLTITKDMMRECGLLLEVSISFSGAVSQAVSVTRKSGINGVNYSPVLDSATLSSATTYRYKPNPADPLKIGDVITVACANSTTPAVTAYSEIRFREDS